MSNITPRSAIIDIGDVLEVSERERLLVDDFRPEEVNADEFSDLQLVSKLGAPVRLSGGPGFPPWEPATRCTSGPQAGTLVLMKWIMEHFGNRGAMNWGIFNCRPVRGGGTTSLHSEGRAADVGFAVGDPDGDRLLKLLLKAPGLLGIQAIIYERRIYSAKSPEGRYYDGVAPHYDHLHIEQTREAAARLTYATVDQVLTDLMGPHLPGTRTVKQGMTGEDVRFIQKIVGADVDGIFGPRTQASVERWERRKKEKFPRLWVDGVVGRLTWRIMGIQPKY